MKRLGLLVFVLVSLISIKSYSHCEIPCGIYGDSLRFQLIAEDISTIEKSMNQINELSKAATTDYNQLVRWVNNKDEHANKIQDVVSQYFLHQRVKVVDDSSDHEAYEKYVQQLILLHKLSVYAMKSKQTTDLKYVELLRETLKDLDNLYFHKHEH